VLKAWRAYLGSSGGDEPIATDASVGYDPKRVATALGEDPTRRRRDAGDPA
jgi:hypothetical protein